MTGRKKILITDDDPINRKLIEAILEDRNYFIRSVASGQATLDEVSTDPPDLILLDLMMPKMDGFEVTRRLKANPTTRAIPIIMVTAIDDSGSRNRLSAVGVSEVVTKPLDRWILLASIDKLLGDVHANG
ncbi:MAG: response regulator [Methylomonas sp.]|nr:response regulator [Methylomonas sp.]